MKKFLVFCLSSILFLTVGIVSSVAQNNGVATIVESRQDARLEYRIHVQDNAGEPIIGANILIEGTTEGTVTDVDGNGTIHAVPGDVIIISFIGYQTQNVQLRNNHNITVTLQEDIVPIP